MKKILLVIGLVVSFICDAQVKQQMGTYGIRARRIQPDSAFRIPTVQVGIKDQYLGFDTAQIYYRKSDSSLLTYTGSQWILARGAAGGGVGTVTSVGLTMPSAFSVANSPVTGSGSLDVTGAGTTLQYIRGDGSLATLPVYTAGDGLLLTASDFKVLTKRSITIDNDSLMLVNDTTATPADHYYGFNSAGRRGYYPNSSLVGINLYNSDGTLTGNRTVATSDKTLTISSGSSYDQLGLGETTPYWQQFITKDSRYVQLDATTDGANVSEFAISSRGPTSSNISVYSFDQDGFYGQMSAPGGVYSSFQFDPDSLFMQPWLGQLNIDSLRTWTAVGDTTYKKPMTWDTRNGRWEYASNWFGGGGATPTLQQVLTAGSTLTGDNEIVMGGHELRFSDNGSGDFQVIGTRSTSIISGTIELQTTADSIFIEPYLGELNIDSLRSWTAIADSAYKRIMTWDERNGRWEYFDGYFPTAGSGSTSPAGNYGNVQLNRNGAFATPASDSVDYESATGLTVKNNVNVEGTGKYFYGRWRARVDSTTSSGTPTINTDNVDVFKITALAAAITSMTTNLSGTPQDGDILELVITDNGTARGITWGASFVSTTVTLPATTTLGVTLTVILQYYKSSSYGNNKWHCVNYY